jgi:hypothetical protein
MVEAAPGSPRCFAELEEERTVESQGRIENIRRSGAAMEMGARDPGGGVGGFLEQVSW